MSTLEIIHSRSIGVSLERLSRDVMASINGENSERVVVLFQRRVVETDLAVHITWKGRQTDQPSDLGMQLTSALKQYGLVTHTVWTEVDLSTRPPKDGRRKNGSE